MASGAGGVTTVEPAQARAMSYSVCNVPTGPKTLWRGGNMTTESIIGETPALQHGLKSLAEAHLGRQGD